MNFTPMTFNTQPLLKLATANMGLLMRFGSSPEMLSQATLTASQLMQQSGATSMRVMQSGAFSQLMQGMLKNYTEFLGESGRSAMAMISEGQASMARSAQETMQRATSAPTAASRRRSA